MGETLLLINGNIINYDGSISSNTNILIGDGNIVYVGDNCPDADTIYNCKGKFISPSFVNLHTHSPMNIFKGIADDVTIESWFNDIIWPYEKKLTKEDIYHGARVAAAEMLSYGISAYADHYFYPEEIIMAALDLGIKIDMAPTLFSLGGNALIDLEDTMELSRKYKENKDVVISLGPHSPYTCTEEFLELVGQYANKYNLKIHIHVSETKEQVEKSLKEKEITPIEVLFRNGLFNNKTILAHGLYITEGDLKFLNKNITFALSPKTYLKLNMGFGNILSFKGKIEISIGTDGAASSNTLNPLEQGRLLGLIGKHLLNDGTDFTLLEIWGYLMKGHDVLEFNSGKIQEGYSADLIIWNLNTPKTEINTNVLSSIIYSSDSENIDSTLISGRFIKKDGKFSLDVSDSINHCKRKISKLVEEGGAESELRF